MQNADLQGQILRHAKCTGTDFTRAKLQDVDFSESDLFGANFHFAKLAGANLAGADMRGSKLRSTNLKRANLAGADLREGMLIKAAGPDSGDIVMSDLTACALDGAKLNGTNLNKAKMDRCTATNAEMKGATKDIVVAARVQKGGEPRMISSMRLQISRAVRCIIECLFRTGRVWIFGDVKPLQLCLLTQAESLPTGVIRPQRVQGKRISGCGDEFFFNGYEVTQKLLLTCLPKRFELFGLHDDKCTP